MPNAGASIENPGASLWDRESPSYAAAVADSVVNRSVSGRLAVIEAKKPGEAFPAYDRSGPVVIGGRQDELTAQTRMVLLLVVLRQVLADRGCLARTSACP